RLVSTAQFIGPEVNLIQGPTEESSQLGKEEDWHARLEEMFPFHFNTIQVTNGTVRFLAPGIEARDAITAKHVNGSITNITNVVHTGKETFSQFRLDADV